MKIFGEKLSRAERVLWTADECDLTYEHIPVPVNGEKGEELLSINPDGAIPTLDDDGFVLTQSWAITLYLARKHGLTDHTGHMLYTFPGRTTKGFTPGSTRPSSLSKNPKSYSRI